MVDLQDEQRRAKQEAERREALIAENRRVANATRYTREIRDLAVALASLNEFTVERGNSLEIERQKRAVVLRLNVLLGVESE